MAAVIAIGAVAAPASAAGPVIPGDVAINDGAPGTNDLHVTVSTPAVGATQMRPSNDGLTFAAPTAKSDSVSRDLGDTNYGTQSNPARPTVYVAYDNGDGTWDSEWIGFDNIVFDVTPPDETTIARRVLPGRHGVRRREGEPRDRLAQ